MALRVRADFAVAECVGADAWCWVASPEPGVERVLLDRIGDEVAVATSIVRYAPQSRFGAHRHERGEEFLVLDGVFADEFGRYPAGTYVRNPPGSAHAPRSDDGCLLFVKLRQFQHDDRERVVVDLGGFVAPPDSTARVRTLHRFAAEEVTVLEGGTGAEFRFEAAAVPREALVLNGCVEGHGRRLAMHDWLRVPAGEAMTLRCVAPARVFVKTRAVLE